MSSRNIVIAAIVIIVVVIVVGWMIVKSTLMVDQKSSNASVTQGESPVPTTEQSSPSGSMKTEGSTIKISSSGFSQKDITIKVGESVTWTNEDSTVHNVSSAPHPTHTAYPPLNLGNIQAGGKVSLVFPEAGTYKYHNHLTPTLFGSVTVE